MKSYINIFIQFTKNNIIREMEYRANFLILMGMDIFWVFFQLFIIQVMFQYTDQIYGWNKYEIYFLMGYFRFIKGFFDSFIRPNLLLFPSLVTKGELDPILTKPLNTIFMISTRRQDFVEFGSSIAGFAVMVYSYQYINLALDSTQVFVLMISAICSFICFYSVFFIFTTLAIFIPRMTALRPFYDLITNFARYPGQIFSQGRLIYEIVLIPIFLITTIPVQVILRKAPLELLILEVIGTLIVSILSLKFWDFAIKRYSSASS